VQNGSCNRRRAVANDVVHKGLAMKERVQFIVWTVEIVAFLAAIAVGRFVWRFGKRKSCENVHD
jgi:hypothetical protein